VEDRMFGKDLKCRSLNYTKSNFLLLWDKVPERKMRQEKEKENEARRSRHKMGQINKDIQYKPARLNAPPECPPGQSDRNLSGWRSDGRAIRSLV